MGYKSPEIAQEVADRLLKGNKDVHILDVCAGTGLIAAEVNMYGLNWEYVFIYQRLFFTPNCIVSSPIRPIICNNGIQIGII